MSCNIAHTTALVELESRDWNVHNETLKMQYHACTVHCMYVRTLTFTCTYYWYKTDTYAYMCTLLRVSVALK